MARPTGRGVRAVENGIRSLPPMARRRSLAAHSGNALALAMMLSPHSRYISSTVGLVRGRGILAPALLFALIHPSAWNRYARKLATSSPGTERRGLYPSGSRMKLYPPDLTFGGCCSNQATVPSHTTR